jgi:CHAD domain-containing protein
MARVTATRSRRTVRLRTAKGSRQVALPRPDARKRPRRGRPARPRETLEAAVEDRGERFRRRLRRGIPIGSRKRIDNAVHDLRTSARRLLAALETLRPFLDVKRYRRLSRRIESVLDRSGNLRDVGIELEMLPGVAVGSAEPMLRRLRERLLERHEQGARKLHRRLRRRGAPGLRRDLRRVLKRSRHGKTPGPAAVRRAALRAARERFARLRKSRLAVNPSELETIHRTRIELKKFRYLTEALRPVAVGIGKKELESLHQLQTTMGDLHDLEVLSSAVARHVAKMDPEAAAQAAPLLQALEVRHSAMLASFLTAVDPILDAWGRLVSSERRWGARR